MVKAMRAAYVADIRKNEIRMVLKELNRYIKSAIRSKENLFDIPDADGKINPSFSRAVGLSCLVTSGEFDANSDKIYRTMLSRDYAMLEFRDSAPDLCEFWAFSANAVFYRNSKDYTSWNRKLSTAIKKVQQTDGSYKPTKQIQKIMGADARLYTSALAGYIMSIAYRYKPWQKLP